MISEPPSLTTTYDPELIPGARNAILTCLRVQPGERVTLIADRQTKTIGASLADQAREAGAEVHAHLLEAYGERPMAELPAPILASLEWADVSIYAAQALTDELRTRIQMCEVVDRRKIRHAHMVSITERIMREGMRADFHEVDAIGTRVLERALRAERIVATTPAGTHLEATFDPSLKWLKTSGLISPDKWGNLPGGEVLTCPARVDGVYVVDGVVGDYLCARYGDIHETPLTVTIENSRLVDLHCDRRELVEDVRAYTRTAEHSDRVGEFAIGTNVAVREIIGNILQDEKMPGLHLAFGHPYTRHTGADWSCPTHLDIVGRKFDIWIDGEQIMAGGRFLI